MREICTSGLTRGVPAHAGISTLLAKSYPSVYFGDMGTDMNGAKISVFGAD